MHSTTRKRSKFTELVLFFSLCRPVRRDNNMLTLGQKRRSTVGGEGANRKTQDRDFDCEFAINN